MTVQRTETAPLSFLERAQKVYDKRLH